MIVAHMRRQDTDDDMVVLVLEPGNLEKLKIGQPIHKWLNECRPGLPRKIEIMLTYSPDVEWVSEQMQSRGDLDAERFAQIIDESLSRQPVINRAKSAEEVKRYI